MSINSLSEKLALNHMRLSQSMKTHKMWEEGGSSWFLWGFLIDSYTSRKRPLHWFSKSALPPHSLQQETIGFWGITLMLCLWGGYPRSLLPVPSGQTQPKQNNAQNTKKRQPAFKGKVPPLILNQNERCLSPRSRQAVLAADYTLANFRHLVLYSRSSLAEQTTPVAGSVGFLGVRSVREGQLVGSPYRRVVLVRVP